MEDLHQDELFNENQRNIYETDKYNNQRKKEEIKTSYINYMKKIEERKNQEKIPVR